jgi:hypothetical protein
MAKFLAVIYIFNEILVNIPMIFLLELEKNSKIHMEAQKTPNWQINPENKRAMQELLQCPTSNYTTGHSN